MGSPYADKPACSVRDERAFYPFRPGLRRWESMENADCMVRDRFFPLLWRFHARLSFLDEIRPCFLSYGAFCFVPGLFGPGNLRGKEMD